ncbi:sialate O-acetylesterase [Prolixibacteraceae bacterium JC049]|nr:sialate O-acetylesterase [Prolixibacteraceae bacterium JC049]
MKLQLFIFFLICALGVQAKVKLPALVGDHMVLQRNAKVKVWGWARPGERIFVKGSWSGASARTIAGKDGKWNVSVRTLDAGGPYSMTIMGENRINIKNILFGEVWFCSGQSNMEFTIKRLGGWDSKWYANDAQKLKNYNTSNIRLFTVKRKISNTPVDDCEGNWAIARPDDIENFSATAWFFGLNLHEKLRIPIGLISSSWGGTGAEVWIPEEYGPRYDPDGWFESAPNKSKWWPGKPGVLYNGMVNPVLNYKIKGVIWYQGEANRKQADRYVSMMETLALSWRRAWRTRFPFYFVQIAPFNYKENKAGALLREAQWEASKVLSRSGMAVTMDIGEKDDIHPKNKQEVGHRLALLAMKKTYGNANVNAESPSFRRVKQENGQLRIYFDNCTKLNANKATLEMFEVAAADKEFHKAEAKVEGNTIVVRSAMVKEPVAVRFAFENFAVAKLLNEHDLPASSFRSDEWLVEE